MNDDTISRQAAIDAMDCVTDSICAQQAIDALIGLPSAERRGRWIDITKCGGYSVFKCSECGDLQLEESYYCPNCGAKMDEENDG